MLLLRTAISFSCALPLILPMVGIPLPGVMQIALATIVQFFGGYPFYIGMFRRALGMNTLVALGTSAAYGYSLFHYPRELYFETSAFLISFILLGKVFESRAYEKAASGMQALLRMQPKMAFVARDGEFIEVPMEEITIGDLISLKPGASVPVDGNVVSGKSTLDESMLTGESLPVSKKEGDKVFAGTVNKEGRLEIEASALGEKTSLGRIIRLTKEAQKSKPPIQKLADTVSSYFIPSVLGVSLLTFLIWWLYVGDFSQGIKSAITVLVIACPCALGLATPTVIMVGVARCASRGILIKDAAGLERAASAEVLLIDKTGTVTEGKPQVVSADETYLPIAASIAQYSEHPYSEAIAKRAEGITLPSCDEFISHPGKGVSGTVNGISYFLGADEEGVALLKEGEKVALFTFADSIKENAKEAVNALHSLGRKLILLSGDREIEVARVAKEVGMDGYFARVLPDEKQAKVKELQAGGDHVGMVGDGVNDAPALSQADVGFAIGSGTDVAMEAASVGLMRNSLEALYEAIVLSMKIKKKIRQNLFFAFFYNTLGIPIAAMGLLNPIIAGVAMALSSISVVANALTIKS